MVPLKSNNKQIIALYDYQKIAFTKLVAALKTTFRALMVMATGLGKTILSIEVVKQFITPKDRILFLCHDNGILNKAHKDYKKYLGNTYTYAKFYGEGKDWEADKHNFVFATFQSILANLRDENTKQKLFSPEHFTFIVVDESHHAQAETFAEVINYFKPKYKLGMTATPDREDEADIRDIFGEEIVDIRLPEAIANNWLTPIDYKVLSDGLDDEKIREVCKEVLEDNVRLTEKQINEKIFIKVRTEEQCKIVQRYSKTQKAIVFCENIEHLHHVASILPSSVTIHSEQSDKVNDFNFDLFEHGHVQHVIVVDKFNEGIDIPDTELLVFLRATNSERIFYQQLGRGLRPVKGKEKVTVLDFVANIDRIKQVTKLTQEIERILSTSMLGKESHTLDTSLHVEGKGFRFDFSDQVVNILSVFERIENPFYETWQEASQSTIVLGINSSTEYYKRYKEDKRLPSAPHQVYGNFPGFIIFLGNVKKDFYPTWQEASSATLKLGIDSQRNYRQKYKDDPKLPSDPRHTYQNFPGWVVFLGGEEKRFYLSLSDASKSVQELGIKGFKEYKIRYKEDPLLHSNPDQFYSDFPGWDMFLLGIEGYYKTWKEASEAALKLGIDSQRNYHQKYKDDPRLPSAASLKRIYLDFPGFNKFLGREDKKSYDSWVEASNAVKKLGITNIIEYRRRYTEDPLLPSSPLDKYTDLPSWVKFFGKE